MELWFESPAGTKYPSLRFELGQRIRIVGVTSGLIGMESAEITIVSDDFAPLRSSLGVNWEHMFWWDLNLPNVITTAYVTAVGTGWLGTKCTKQVQIGIGVDPEPPPGSKPIDWGKYLLIGGVALVSAFVVSNWLGRKKP